MISSQLGRMILDNTRSSADEMSSDYSRGSDPIDELLEDVATRIGGDRRPGGRSSIDQRPVNQPS